MALRVSHTLAGVNPNSARIGDPETGGTGLLPDLHVAERALGLPPLHGHESDREALNKKRDEEKDAMMQTDRFSLVDFDDAPIWLQDNIYIVTGYRAFFSVKLCLTSIFKLHNETLNIHTHLWGFIFFLVMSIYSPAHFLPADATTDRVVFGVYFASILVCLLNSTLYHTFGCHSHHANMKLISLDYVGIFALVTGSFIPPLYYGFVCWPTLRTVYIAFISVVGGMGTFGPCFEFYHRKEFRFVRVCVFAVMALFGFVPMINGAVLEGFARMMPLGLRLCPIFLIYGLGFGVYVARIPEKWYPGKFDVWGHSHQIMHVSVVLAALYHYYTCKFFYEYTREPNCPA